MGAVKRLFWMKSITTTRPLTQKQMHGPSAPHVYASPDRLECSTLLYLRSLDNYAQLDKRKKGSALTQALEYVIYQNKEAFSFFNYRIG